MSKWKKADKVFTPDELKELRNLRLALKEGEDSGFISYSLDSLIQELDTESRAQGPRAPFETRRSRRCLRSISP